MKKIICDHEADHKQMLYRGCIIQEQDHPMLLKYACYTNEDGNKFIDVCSTKKQAKEIIDEYLKNK